VRISQPATRIRSRPKTNCVRFFFSIVILLEVNVVLCVSTLKPHKSYSGWNPRAHVTSIASTAADDNYRVDPGLCDNQLAESSLTKGIFH
jgi:hypothetical protein